MMMATNFVVSIVETFVDFSDLIVSQTNYKDQFIKYYQNNHNNVPKFYDVKVGTNMGNKEYQVCIKNREGSVISSGKGTNKKQAESNAAYNALKYFGQLKTS
jgi:dsRNA-specific ribonuclease